MIRNNYIQFFQYNVDIKLGLTGFLLTVHFYLLCFQMNPEITQFDIIKSKLLQQLKKNTNVNLCNNNSKHCSNKLYYDCKHLIM